MNYMKSIILFILLFYFNIFSQNPPADFKLVGTTGGTTPWSESETITILADGQVSFFKFREGGEWDILQDTNFTILVSNVQQIWQAIQNNNFFSLSSTYQDDTLQDGSFALLTITANGTTKQVRIKNISQQEIEEIINSVNSNVPAEFNLDYMAPEKINIIPTDPCQGSGIIPKIFEGKNFPEQDGVIEKNKVNQGVQIPHGGVEIGYEISLFEAVAAGIVTLKSKGEFFGDGVSITGNHPLDYSPPDNTISIKLYLEFYGPCDNAANVTKIVASILNKWNGHTTSDGKTIQMEVVSLSHPGATSPPCTPGFNNIKLECGEGISTADIGIPNSDGVGGVWYPSEDAELFAHEAGHLMGLHDQYDEYSKQADGSWLSEDDGTIQYSPDEFLNLFLSNYPHLTLSDAQKYLNNGQRITWPKPGHKEDIMGDFTKPPLQSDVDLLAAQAGLIIKINSGDIFTNTKTFRQNLVVIHTGDLFLAPGETKTLEGIYTACIDNARIPPGDSEVLNIAPSLDKWNGVPAAEELLKLVRHVDSMRYYCGDFYDVQFAVWRITDNASDGTQMIDSLFINAGIDIGTQLFYFPRLIDDLPDDTVTKVIVPKELFIPEITPESIQGQIGQNLDFNSAISGPEGFNYTTSSSWILNKPEGSSSQISSEGSFTPDKRGLYNVSVNLNITDPQSQSTEYISDKVAFASVADKFTETFEHQDLTYAFEWETYGDEIWGITDETAHTGSYSAKAGNVSNGDSSTLAINVNLPTDTSIAFAVKTFSNNAGALFFEVDGVMIDYWNNSEDWQLVEFDLTAGTHRLVWTFRNNNVINPAQVWLDNIFFPANSVVTGIEYEENIPLTFHLSQNFPNPFNPTTKIKYSVPTSESMNVTLKVFDILGNEMETLVNEEKQAGVYEVTWHAKNVSSGVYFYRIKAGDYIMTRKMILVR